MRFHGNDGGPIYVLAYYDFLKGRSLLVLFEYGKQLLFVLSEVACQLTQRIFPAPQRLRQRIINRMKDGYRPAVGLGGQQPFLAYQEFS